MITLNTSRLEKFSLNLDNKEFSAIKNNLKNNNQGWLDLTNTTDIGKITTYTDSIKSEFSHVIIVGIGGSALGITAIKESLLPLNWNELTTKKRNHRPTFHILDNIDPALIQDTLNVVDLEKTLFIIITKSGTTPETISQYLYFRDLISTQLGPEAIRKHFLFITSAEKGYLHEVAKKENINSFNIPENVGGRFSVLSPVGMVPAALMGLDLNKIMDGAQTIKEDFFSSSKSSTTSYELAKLQHHLNQKSGININVLMPYSNRLFKIADWYRQLLAESIGKETNLNGQKVNVGITPVNALGATDQHSQIQLYNEGPKDKLIIFLNSKISHSASIDQNQIITTSAPENLNYLNNISFKTLLDTEAQATSEALTNYQVPNIDLNINSINETTIGALFMFFQLNVGILGELFNINTYNQPGVELAKKLTKSKLS